MKTQTYIFAAILVFLQNISFSQQLPQFSQRMFDETNFNPAINGTKEHSSIKLHHRSQWIGFSQAPSTQSMSFDGIINQKMGAGGSIINDITGSIRKFGISLAYSYHIKTENFNLSFGLSGTILQTGIDGTKVNLQQDGDPIIAENLSDKAWKPDAGFGAYLYSEKFYAGIGIQQLFQSKFQINAMEGINAEMPLARHYYLNSGYKISINESWDLEPSILFSGTIGSPAAIDFNLKTDYKSKFVGGISYRVNDAFVLLAGYKLQEVLSLYYSYDLLISKLRKYNSGSHELMLVFLIMGKQIEASSF
jgi:type IX secretion system PorP/SprF family membrane protein